ncbi:MAG: hypothetical protein WC061_00440 [Melioribacteraceae bacterium]
MKNFWEEEKKYLDDTFRKLTGISGIDAAAKQNARWSKKEIIGHLIDSASNNHQRFVRAQFTDDLIFPGYDQDEWVRIQNYQIMDWTLLINLWKEFNFLIIHLSGQISGEEMTRPRPNHNLDKIAWRAVPRDQPATLEYFIRDYFGHMRHHINQLFEQNNKAENIEII